MAAAVALVALGAVLGVVLGRLAASPGPWPQCAAGKPVATLGTAVAGGTAPMGAGPSRMLAGVPVGYRRSEAGAKAAAANYAAAIGSPLSLTGTSVRALPEAIAAPGQDRALAAKLETAATAPALADLIRDADRGAPFALRTVPLAMRTRGTYTGEQVTVQVYSATYLVGSHEPARAGYGLGSYRLRWAHDDWKLAGYHEEPQVGPIPSGYFAPSTGWQPSNGQGLDAIADSVRDALSGTAPIYTVH